MMQPTPDRELNDLLEELVRSAQAILGENFTGAYLQGSFAVGDWDFDSDVDFLIAVREELSEAALSDLQVLHGRLYDLPSHWAQHLEGSYVPLAILRQEDPTRQPLYFLDNTSRTLELSDHDNSLVVRWVVREYGIPLVGPQPSALIDPIDPDALRREVRRKMHAWAGEIFRDPAQMNNRWYQPYAVLSYCRMLHTLETARIISKPAAAAWAKQVLEPRWAGLIERAWADRPDPSWKVRQPADPDDFASTLEFLRYALSVAGPQKAPLPYLVPPIKPRPL